MPWPTADYRLPHLLSNGDAARLMDSSGKDYFVYLLVRPDGSPFYVGQGANGRVFNHEAEARSIEPKNKHKCNIIQKILRQGGSIYYALDLMTNSREEALAREIVLIRLIGRHDLNAGPLSNLSDGGEGCTNWSEQTRSRHLATLGGVDAADVSRASVNGWLEALLPGQSSKTIKPLSSFKPKRLVPINKPMGVTYRQAATLAAAAVASGVALVPGCRIPRRFVVKGVECAVENGCGGDILKSGLASLTSNSPPTREIFTLDAGQVRQVVAVVGRETLTAAGVQFG